MKLFFSNKMGNVYTKTSNEVSCEVSYDKYQNLLNDLRNEGFKGSIETPINSIFKHLIIRFMNENEKSKIIEIIESNSFNMSSFKEIIHNPHYAENYRALALCLWYK
jgi:hypothetical protein